MIFDNRSNFMLKYEKAKAKLIEFNIAKEDYPHFQLNSDDLIYITLYTLSRYCEEMIENPGSDELRELFSELTNVSQYFDSAVKSKSRQKYDNLFLLLGATSYFLAENFGSAKVLISQIDDWSYNKGIMDVLYETLFFLSSNKKHSFISFDENSTKYFNAFCNHFDKGDSIETIYNALNILREQAYQSQDIFNVTYIDLLYGVSICATHHSAWVLLSKHSDIKAELWKKYLLNDKSIKLLWPAQRVILEAGILTGKDIVVPLPTGVGKTKSIELLLRSVFMDTDTCVTVIVAPLRALCNEITTDLSYALGDIAVINQFTDTMQEDFDLEILHNTKYVFVCTPEKISYILRHEPDFLQTIKLFIFDESHLFDDDTRGVQYELLVSEVARSRSSSAQLVLFSAVLSNANQISDWLFHDVNATIDSSLVKSTEKTVGFLSSDHTIHYYEKDEMSMESFYVPQSVKTAQLQLKPKERTARFFPENKSQDLAIYYAVNLSKGTGVAIFAGQARSIPSIMRRIVELDSRGYDFSELVNYGDITQINSLYELFRQHYGEESELSKVVKMGILPHYANLPNGIKMAIEYALRKRHAYLVICTTTLAEGVNIPIKYLILTTFSYGDSKLQIRKMQNLIGRTARSGIHTEGSVIVTDSKYFDNRLNWKNGGGYQWENCKKMFNYGNAEACMSAILRLVSGLRVDYANYYRGNSLSTYLIQNYKAESCFSDLKETLRSSYRKRVSESIFKKYNYIIDQKVNQIEHIIEGIENYLCYIYSIQADQSQFMQSVKNLTDSTFAFYLADEEQKKNLEKIFQVIAEKILDNVKTDDVPYFAKSLYGINTSRYILQWVDENILMLTGCQSDELLRAVSDLFMNLFSEQIDISKDIFTIILNEWVSGELYIDIYNDLGQPLSMNQIEKLCAKTFSYDLCFLIGNVIDAIGDRDNNLSDSFSFLQKQIKYGVSSYFRILICENVFDERYLSGCIESIISGSANITTEKQLRQILKAYNSEILAMLENFPEYFSHRFREYISKQ